MISPNGVNTFDGSWFSALNAVESEIPTFTTPFTKGYSEIAVELNFQDGVWAFLTKIQSCNREREFHMGFATVGKRTKTLDVH